MTKYLNDLTGKKKKKTDLLEDESWALFIITVVCYKRKIREPTSVLN